MADGALANKILIGDLDSPLYTYVNRNLSSGSLKGMFSVDTIGNELAVDTFSFVVHYNSNANLIYAPVGKDGYVDTNNAIYMLRRGGRTPEKDYLKDVAYGTSVWWYVANAFFAKGYVKSIERIAKYAWKVTCQSGIGLLDEQMHVGGMYSGTKFSVILSDIINGAFAYSVNSAVGNTLVYGHLPYDTARNNLHTLLFALGASMTRKANTSGDYNVIYLSQSTIAVPSSRIALGGSVQTQNASNQAEVTEHSFEALASDPVETLYDNTGGTGNVDHALVVFSDPMHDLSGSGITIHESNCNYAIISGTGTLTGKKYTHIEKIVTMSNVATGDTVRAKRVTENRLISPANSLNAARRVLSYYGSARTLKAKIMLNNEKCGTNLALNDAFGEPTTAYLQKADVLVTSVNGAQCELIEGYVPAWNGNNYTQRQLITASGTITIPAGVTAVRLILIGGGTGGSGGYDGERGQGGGMPAFGPGDPTKCLYSHYDDEWGMLAYYWSASDQALPQGGAAGEPGESGKIYVIDIETSGGESATVSIGAGGAGGASNGGLGTAGGNTTVTIGGSTYTSADGAQSAAGFIDALGNKTYALPGTAGHRGGNGGQVDIQVKNGCNGASGCDGESVGSYAGGRGGTGIKQVWVGTRYNTASGGGAGGAAWGAAGGAGGNASVEAWGSGKRYRCGSGGDGANAVAPTQPTYGNGGGGGNGGGAGGNVAGGIVYAYYESDWSPKNDIQLTVKNKEPGAGDYDGGRGGYKGLGSVGGKGGDGCVIVYY